MLATALSVNLAHAGEEEASNDLLTTIGHQPMWLSLILCAAVLLACFGLLTILKIKLVGRLLALVPIVIGLSIFYMQHDPTVSALLLSAGFVGVFLLVFPMLKGN